MLYRERFKNRQFGKASAQHFHQAVGWHARCSLLTNRGLRAWMKRLGCWRSQNRFLNHERCIGMLSPDVLYPIEKATKRVVFLKNFITNPNILVGDYTYYDGREEPERFQEENVVFGRSAKLFIGKFCQIAYGTQFILSDANHQMNGFSTFPFFIFGTMAEGCPEWAHYDIHLSHGDTHIGNDVWFGHESSILPKVRIGDGAIIGAKAVVTKDVPPYAIVGGNPAKILRMRFPQEVIERLQKIRWWDWDYGKITRNLNAIAGGDIRALEEAK